ncbi:hypothetical protein COO60DRAFT_87877 [Scenedesmus sp. NREL 46B-D3]|nr:hypothetical protein COO60DRAFT_87877 [Scenedesmus sp. NREL 46B-D3]
MSLCTAFGATYLVSTEARPLPSAFRRGSSSRSTNTGIGTCRAWGTDSQAAFEFFMSDFLEQWQQAAEEHKRLSARHMTGGSQHCTRSHRNSCSRSKHNPPNAGHMRSHHHGLQHNRYHHKSEDNFDSNNQQQQQEQQQQGQSAAEIGKLSATATNRARDDSSRSSSSRSSTTQMKPEDSSATAAVSEGASHMERTADMLLPLDVVDTAAAYVLYADVPGIENAQQLSIQVSQQRTQQQQQPAAAAAAAAAAPAAAQQQQQMQDSGRNSTRSSMCAPRYQLQSCSSSSSSSGFNVC